MQLAELKLHGQFRRAAANALTDFVTTSDAETLDITGDQDLDMVRRLTPPSRPSMPAPSRVP